MPPILRRSGGGAARPLAAADRAYDLQPVALQHRRVAIAALGHDLSVLLHGDSLSFQPEQTDERRDVTCGAGECLNASVDDDFHVATA